MNLVVLKGRLTKQPELKQVNDKCVCNFDVAVNRRFGEETDFFKCQAWNKTAEFVDKFFIKGQEILIQGEVQNRSYKDKEGNNRYITEIKVDNVEFCGSKKDVNTTISESNPLSSAALEGFEMDDSEIPF